jgi:putative FmdB family regulatory protein
MGEQREDDMPIYEYACAKCESEFEVEQRITEDPLKSCPKCRSRRIKRLISRTSFALKGGGWYADGYASNGGDKRGGGDSATADSSETPSKKDDSSSDKKAEKAPKGKKAVA